MKTARIALSLLSVALLGACSTSGTQSVATHTTLEQRTRAKYAVNDVNTAEPAPPAEGPQDVPSAGPADIDHNPTIVPSPLLRQWASSHTP